MVGFKKSVLASVFIIVFISGCGDESSEVKSAMEKYANIIPSPRSYSECKGGADIIEEYTLNGRDAGVSVNDAIRLLDILDIDASLSSALSNVFRAIWKSKESASSLSNMYMEICNN